MKIKSAPAWIATFVAIILSAGGCGGDNDPLPPPPPSILNINGTSDPASPVGLAIEINGSNFLSSPGQVSFTEAGTGVQAVVIPDTWSSTGIVVVVPTGTARPYSQCPER